MPVGFQVFNDDGIIQIDENTINFVMVTKGSVTCSTPESSGGVTRYVTTIVVAGVTSPLLALSDTDRVAHTYTNVSGSTWTFHIMSLTNGATVDYWIFDRPSAAPSYSPGDVFFELYNAAGELVYWLDAKPLRIVGVGGGTYPSGRVYATIQTACGWRWNETNPGMSAYRYVAFYGAASVNGNVIVTASNGIRFEDYTVFGYGPFDPQSYSPPAYSFLVVDVTNF